MENLVTVVVTSYNHSNYIEECIQSIFSQTFSKLELIIIDDASTDDSVEKIKKLLLNSPFPAEKIFLTKNGGLVNARNIALSRKLSKYVLFVDSDNYLPRDYIEKLYVLAEKTNKDIIYADLKEANSDKTFMKAREYSLESLLLGNYIDSCSLIRTDIIGNIRYDTFLNYKKLEDYDFVLNLIIRNNAQPLYCKDTYLNYRVLSNSLSRQGNHNSEQYYYEIYLYIISKFLDLIPNEINYTLKTTILGMEKRIFDLVTHLSDVTNYVLDLEKNNQTLDQKNITLSEKYKEEIENHRAELINEKNKLKLSNKKNEELSNLLKAKQDDYVMVINSTSYRVGNKIVNFVKRTIQIVKNPKSLGRAVYHLSLRVIRKIKKQLRFKRLIYTQLRNFERKKNVYSDPKRIMIFVIYENGSRIQKYKLFFLDKIAKLVDKIVIVSNTQLDTKSLNELKVFGEVHIRENTGYDTAAFRYGINLIKEELIENYDELLLVNDTNVGPFFELSKMFDKMEKRQLDLWGISYGEEQPDFTGMNPYGYIPKHLQSFFLVIEKSLFSNKKFFEYWDSLEDTNSREKAIGKHETVFTRYFEDLGFKQGAVTNYNEDSPMYIHPLKMIKKGVPIVKYSAFSNYDDDKFLWQGLVRKTEIPDLIEYIKTESDYPISIINDIVNQEKKRTHKKYILIIDGVENVIPQLTTYRVNNKVEQLKSLGYNVWKVNASSFEMGYAENASHIIIYRATYSDKLSLMVQLAKKYGKPVLYDIDDLVIDTKYTNQLSYVKNLSPNEKRNYDLGVRGYENMLKLCDGAIATTKALKKEMEKYKPKVFINRNLASNELINISEKAYLLNKKKLSNIVKIGYFSGSITHNENFNLIKHAILKILNEYENVELHLVGHIDLPEELKIFKGRVVIHAFVDWKELPYLISEVDINLGPLTKSIFNEAKSEIKWIEASLVRVTTVASKIGSFEEMIKNGETGFLVDDHDWFNTLSYLINHSDKREKVAKNAYDYVRLHCCTKKHEDELTMFLGGN